MKETLRVWTIVTFMILATVMQMNVMADANAGKFLKEDLEIAVHDAALFLDQQQLAKGKIVFDREKVHEVFIKSLERNANLQLLDPIDGSFYQDAFKVVTFKIIDESNPNVTFPFTYHHPLYDMDVMYGGPTIVAVVETYGPRYFKGQKEIIRRAASYTYAR